MSVRSSLVLDTTALALAEGRRVGQPGHEVAKQYLIARLEKIGLQSFGESGFEMPFGPRPPQPGPAEFANLVGLIPGRDRSLKPLLVGAHYDSAIDGPSADDNATAVAVVLAVAERFVTAPLQRDLIIAIFDAEEPPYFCTEWMGSTRFVIDHCRERQFACALIMDLIGHDVEASSPAATGLLPDLANLLVVTGGESAAYLSEAVDQAAEDPRQLTILPTHTDYVGDMSDYHAFRGNGQPFLFLTCGQGRYYHHRADDLAWINFDKVERVFELVRDLLIRADHLCPTGAIHPADSLRFEVRGLERVFGAALPRLLDAAGLRELRTRHDLTQLFYTLRRGLIA